MENSDQINTDTTNT